MRADDVCHAGREQKALVSSPEQSDERERVLRPLRCSWWKEGREGGMKDRPRALYFLCSWIDADGGIIGHSWPPLRDEPHICAMENRVTFDSRVETSKSTALPPRFTNVDCSKKISKRGQWPSRPVTIGWALSRLQVFLYIYLPAQLVPLDMARVYSFLATISGFTDSFVEWSANYSMGRS